MLDARIKLYQCTKCRYISSSTICPNCENKIHSEAIYPGDNIRELLRMISYFGQISEVRKSKDPDFVPEEEKTIVILAYSVLEGLFYHQVESLLSLKGKSSQKSNQVLKIHRSLKKRKKLFLDLTGSSLRDTINEIETEFYDQWMELNRQRNRFLHETPQAINPEVVEMSHSLINKSIPLFKSINNQIIKNISD